MKDQIKYVVSIDINHSAAGRLWRETSIKLEAVKIAESDDFNDLLPLMRVLHKHGLAPAHLEVWGPLGELLERLTVDAGESTIGFDVMRRKGEGVR